ncbi:LysR substrate-binding domain-containing protein [Amycolatopsis sp. PS_44_ISF1]|uniref:LysR substrate-binding domain-containing protein n=1 Tax=Amycolatopsis sp. PS_44_ISF1 TaxID=2974917 RepID=UPI0028DE079D|nr:LysR substrate-binding domain-containing protein [Amycolatopsis sp. PS_44_ISF1]MDT8914768.1 LysR substrate-binding domain-containing protein [Amycolatopsis sp. PS_44_ISF1]
MLDPRLCRSFLAVAESRSFTAAARRLGVGQPTVSQHIRRLEAAAGGLLFARDTHAVDLTARGQAMLGFAQTIVDTEERAARHFRGAQVRGRVRFGCSEDFALEVLPELLRRLRRSHPLVDVELHVELSDVLAQRLAEGRLDLVLGKRRPGTGPGPPLRREPLVWIGSEATALEPGEPVPLVQYPMPSVTRRLAVEALERAGLDWRAACLTSSLTGLRAAAAAGLGVTVHARSLVPAGLLALPVGPTLPDPGEVEFMLLSQDDAEGPAQALADFVRARLGAQG